MIIVLPLGVFIGNKFFIKSKEQLYRQVVFYFLIIISIIGILRIISNIFESFTAIDGFFHAYFQELGNNDDIFENLMKIEETLLNLSVCKINIDT